MHRIAVVLISFASLFAQERTSTAPALTGVVTGIVVDDEDGRPIADVAVGVRNGWEILFPSKTGTDGRFRISGVRPGEYFMDANKRGYVTYYVAPPILFNVRSDSIIQLAPIRLTATALISGTVLDPWDAPIKGAYVALETESQLRTTVRMYGVSTDDSGGFSFPEVKPGRYIVEATATDRYGGAFLVQATANNGAVEWRQATYSAAYWKAAGATGQWSEISVGPKEKLGNLRLELGWRIGAQVRPNIEAGDTVLRVQIIDQTARKPIPHARLALWHLPAVGSDGIHPPIITTIADTSGVVLLAGLAAGEYDIHVECMGFLGRSFKIHSASTSSPPAPLEMTATAH